MRPVCLMTLAAIELACAAAALAQTATIGQLEQQAKDHPTSLQAKQALAEAYLRDCRLEKSLKLWRTILSADPDHQRARRVVGRLTTQALDLDSHLGVLETLIEKQVAEGTDALLSAAGERAATDPQKARILYLRGRLAMLRGDAAGARAGFRSAMTLYPGTAGAGRAAIALARAEQQAGRTDAARRLLRGVIEEKPPADAAVRQRAMLALVGVASAELTARERIAALRRLRGELTAKAVLRELLVELIGLIVSEQGRWTPAAVEAAREFLLADPSYEQAAGMLRRLMTVARRSEDAATLDALAAALAGVGRQGPAVPGQAALARQATFVRVEALLSRAVAEPDAGRMRRLLVSARRLIDGLAVEGAQQAGPGEPAAYPDRRRVEQLRGRALVVEAQKLAVLGGNAAALPVVLAAKDHYLAALWGEPAECFARLAKIGSLLEQMREWETAVGLYRQIAARFAHLPQGRDALWKIAQHYDRPLDAPIAALDVYAEYAARYPADLPYRQLAIGDRLRRLGYANVLDFQKRNNLKTDGIAGPRTRARLEQLEASLDLIRVQPPGPLRPGGDGPGPAPGGGILRGKFVHPAVYNIARRLEKAGRHRDAIVAYRLFLNLFPSKKEADDCLIAVARLFRDNLLFAEALGAYRELMDDFPKGDMTSLAYVEAAQCLENLGRWKDARALYELYVRKFPKYPHARLCRTRIGLLEEIGQYEEFIAANPDSPKVAEARYQIARILYKQFGNHTKAAVEFAKMADRHRKHVRAPDALFTGGTAQLKAENFPAARKLFAELVSRYPASRLADDAQYWIGHTHEYAARALGRLDRKRVVLKRRSLAGRADLTADLPLRRLYHPRAGPQPQVPSEVWGGDALGVLGSRIAQSGDWGSLASGSKRDRVNAELHRAIRAYRAVVDHFKMGDMAGNALLRIGTIYTKYLNAPEKGVAAYRELLAHYPGSREAVDALFEVGAYQIRQKKLDEAIKSYRQFIYNYPNEAKVEDAMLAIARCHAEKKAWDKALDAYQSYLSKFPNGRHADRAKAQVEWIRMYHF